MGPVDPTATGGTVVTGQEGLTQDTFVLTLDGLAAAYAGKSVAVTISWTVPANDYDLYIFKRNANGTNGAAVGSSANGAPGTSESVTINPASTGVGAYNVIAVYFTTTAAVGRHGPVPRHDQHHHQPHGAHGDVRQGRDHLFAQRPGQGTDLRRRRRAEQPRRCER